MPQPPTNAEALVLKARAIIAEYLPPDSKMGGEDLVDALIELFETPQAKAIAAEHGHPAEFLHVDEIERLHIRPRLRLVGDFNRRAVGASGVPDRWRACLCRFGLRHAAQRPPRRLLALR